MKITRIFPVAMLLAAMAVQALAQATYQPKFKNDPARSDSEAAALGYLRSFFAKMEGTNRRDDGVIRADDQKEADEHSPVLKPDAVPGNTPSLSIVKQRPGRPVAPTLRRQLKRSHASARRAWTNLRCFAV